MFNAWRYSSQDKDGDGADNAQLSQLRKMLEDLRGVVDSQKPDRPEDVEAAPQAQDVPIAHVTPEPEVRTEAAFDRGYAAAAVDGLGDLPAVQRLVAEERKAAEGLLAEVTSLEEMLRAQIMVAQAEEASAAAAAKTAAFREVEQEAQTACDALVSRRTEIEGRQEQNETDVLAAQARIEDSQNEIAKLEERLSALGQRAQEAKLVVERGEAARADLARDRSAVEEGITIAHERLDACRRDTAAAQTEADAAGARASALSETVTPAPSDDALTGLQRLALRIAEEAAAMATVAEEKKRAKTVLS